MTLFCASELLQLNGLNGPLLNYNWLRLLVGDYMYSEKYKHLSHINLAIEHDVDLPLRYWLLVLLCCPEAWLFLVIYATLDRPVAF